MLMSNRFRTLIFWVYEPLETLRPRLSRRVDKMVEVKPLLLGGTRVRALTDRMGCFARSPSCAESPRDCTAAQMLRTTARVSSNPLVSAPPPPPPNPLLRPSLFIDPRTRLSSGRVGYKEFADLNLEQEDPSADPAFGPMLERMKLSTHQYAKSQIKWIRKQLLPAVKEARSLGGNVEVYVVHGGEAGHEPAIKLLNCECQEDKAWD